MTMRTLHTLFFCLLVAALCLASRSISSMSSFSTSPGLFHLHGRRPMRDLRMSLSNQQNAEQEIKVLEETKRNENQPNSFSNEPASIDNKPELVYHIDYHGVTTHPNPTPKHPRP